MAHPHDRAGKEVRGLASMSLNYRRVDGQWHPVCYLGDLRVQRGRQLGSLWRKAYPDLFKLCPREFAPHPRSITSRLFCETITLLKGPSPAPENKICFDTTT